VALERFPWPLIVLRERSSPAMASTPSRANSRRYYLLAMAVLVCHRRRVPVPAALHHDGDCAKG
jgi:hypothetical protein